MRFFHLYHRSSYRERYRAKQFFPLLPILTSRQKICFLRLVKEYADRQGVTEQLKAENQLEWVGKMNNIRSRAV
ncbi:MAG: TnpV protein, partial [Christensenellales bacterium]